MFCRICLIENANGQSIFEKYHGESLTEIVRTIAGIEIIHGDGLPEHVCYACAHILLQAQDIRKRCLESDAVLHAKVLMDQHSQDSLQKIESEKNIFIWETVIQTYEPPPEEFIIKNESFEPEPFNTPEEIEGEISEDSDDEINNGENDCADEDDAEEETYQCSKCTKQFVSKTQFDRHQQYHKLKKCKCPICKYELTHKSNLKRHIVTHKNGPMKCDRCKAVFQVAIELYEHLKDHYKTEAVVEDYIHECNICGQQTKSVSVHRGHMKLEHNIEVEKPFLCRICLMTFTSKQGLGRHIDNIHHSMRKKVRGDDKNLICPTCGKKFTANFHLQVHMRTHTHERRFQCSLCPKSFAQSYGLKVHTLTHTGEKPYACRVCGKRFNQYGHVISHLRTHPNEKAHVCKICSRSFRVKRYLTAHMATHTRTKPFSCEVCGKSFAQSSKLETHYEKVHKAPSEESIIHGDGLPEHVCYACADILLQAQDIRKRCLESDAVLHAKVLMDQHSQDSLQKIESEKNIFIWETVIQTYEPPPEEFIIKNESFEPEPCDPPEEIEEEISEESEDEINNGENDSADEDDAEEETYQCSKCTKQFANKTQFYRHQQYHKQKKCKCPICKHEFTHKYNLKRHIVTHKNGPMKCDRCKAVFQVAIELYEHLKDHYKTEAVVEDYVHECNICGQQTKSVAVHRGHMKLEHNIEVEKPFLCRICLMTFTSKQGLGRHIDNIHHSMRKKVRGDDKNLLCPTCGKKFTASFHLQVHMRTHAHERPFQCSHCPKSFAQASGLKVHTFTHTGEKPYACRVCGKRFNQYGHVRSHLRTHSNEKPHVCKICSRSFRVKKNLNAHMTTHTGTKPFSCEICGKSYAQSSKLETHYEKVHKAPSEES